MKKRKCKNPTCPHDYFYPRRIDHVFCSTKCRNQYNNNAYKLRQEPYKKISDDLVLQDKNLDSLLRGNISVLINYDKFATYSIDLKMAKVVTYYKDGTLKQAIFVKFILTHTKDQQYKLKRK